MKNNFFVLIIFIFLMSSCSDVTVDPTYNENPDIVRKTRGGKFFGDVVLYSGKKKTEAETKVNQEQGSLWVASVEVISGLFPIAIIDATSGIIVTEWHSSEENSDKRVKINALIKGKEVKEENINISVFNQIKNKKGDWEDKKTDNELVIKLIKSKIIEKTQQISGLSNE